MQVDNTTSYPVMCRFPLLAARCDRSPTSLQTDRQTDRRTDGRSISTDLLKNEAGIQRERALPECVIHDIQLVLGEVSAIVPQPLAYQTDTDVVAQRRYLDEAAHAVDRRFHQPPGPGLERVEGRVVSGGGQDEVDIGREVARQPVETVGAMINAQLVQSIQQHHQRLITRSHLSVTIFHRYD